MANYVITTRQMVTSVICVTALLTVSVYAAIFFYEWRQLPEVTLEGDKCIKVINFKNGDAYQCQDVNVVLRNFKVAK